MTVRQSATTLGKKMSPMRRNPYVAAFEMTPERIAETSAGDSR